MSSPEPRYATCPGPGGLQMEESVQRTALLMPAGEAVRLVRDIPECWLSCGDRGVVISTWCSPMVAYEVEFHQPDGDRRIRALVSSADLEVEPSLGVPESRPVRPAPDGTGCP